MSIEIQVNEDIREYEPKVIKDFTARQITSLIVLVAIEGLLYLLTHFLLGQATILLMSIVGIPIILYGFWKPRGFNFEDYASLKFNNSIQLPARGYKNNNCLRELEKICTKYELQEKKKEKKLKARKKEN